MAADNAKAFIRGRAVLVAAIAAIGLAASAGSTLADPADFRIVDRDTGRPLQVWRHNGRTFVAGEPGERYALRLTNHTDGRVLVVL